MGELVADKHVRYILMSEKVHPFLNSQFYVTAIVNFTYLFRFFSLIVLEMILTC